MSPEIMTAFPTADIYQKAILYLHPNVAIRFILSVELGAFQHLWKDKYRELKTTLPLLREALNSCHFTQSPVWRQECMQ